ncbi:hypothetical protein HpDR91_01120 [Helicobacter pylori]
MKRKILNATSIKDSENIVSTTIQKKILADKVKDRALYQANERNAVFKLRL